MRRLRRGTLPFPPPRAWVGLLLLASLAGPLLAQETTTSPHGALQNPCSDCHGEDGWRPARVAPSFRHDAFGFRLAGAHAGASCAACHADLTFSTTPTQCATCHQDVHRGEFGDQCGQCHTERSFLDRARMLERHQATRFLLVGVHRAADCESCHTPAAQGKLQFVARGSECQDCHASAYAAATDPDHLAVGFPRDCARCHAETRWQAARFNHAGSGFPLTGAHRALVCEQCHVGNQYGTAGAACVSCHQDDYDQTTAPSHSQVQFPTDCAACHSTRAWDATFNHAGTRFPLTGAHIAATCQGCHDDGVYSGKPTACEACHLPDFNAAVTPDHRQLGWPTTCTTCHTGSQNTAGWDRGIDLPRQYHNMFSVDHEDANGRCDKCHDPPVYRPATCTDCHRASCSFTSQRGCDD